ncbi:hypothetical protein MHBO_001846 [Bonamia ostreae]|uniref:Importin N-terminal domain-containing protein n=1 Tax=Bonamia ostreae TaxID=126728 RepID=A0ABV2AKC5_9EUKA
MIGNENFTKQIYDSFLKICDGSSPNEIASAKNLLEKLNGRDDYLLALTNILKKEGASENVKILSAIEIKNFVKRKRRNSLPLLKNDNWTSNFAQSILEIYFSSPSCNKKQVYFQMSVAIADIFAHRSFPEIDLISVIKNFLASKSFIERQKSLQILKEILEILTSENRKTEIAKISKNIFSEMAENWGKFAGFLFSGQNKYVKESKGYQILLKRVLKNVPLQQK